jgi:hypothetical protein
LDCNDLFKDDPALHKSVGEYYEVVVPSHCAAPSGHELVWGHVPVAWQAPRLERLSRNILATCPLSLHGPAVLANEQVLDVLRPYLDPVYFSIRSVEIGLDKGARLVQLVSNLRTVDQESVIYAREPWTKNSEAIVAYEPDISRMPPKVDGFSYFLEVLGASEFLEGWLTNYFDREPTAEEKCARLIEYAKRDA